MNPKKVLIITYYWPPSGGSGVQRWLKFVKYLDRAGWETIIFTPENPSFTIQDASLLRDVPPDTEVLKIPIWEPYDLFYKISALFGKKNMPQTDFITTGNKSLFHRWSAWIRGNFFIPDPRIFWVKPASSFLREFILGNQIGKVITTGPPHSIHLIGLKLKKENPALKWVADFRDPWSEWDLLETLSLSGFAKSRHRRLEKKVLQTADRVITIAPFHVRRFEALSNRKVDLITNGFDTEDFKEIKRRRTAKFTIRHVGVVDELRDPRPVMKVLKDLCLKNREVMDHIVVEFIGSVNSAFKRYVHNDEVLSTITRFVNPIHHMQLLEIYGETDLQLLILAHTPLAAGNLPGKFFEYLASGNPVLAIGPPGDAASILQQTRAGKIFDRGDLKGMEAALKEYFRQWELNVPASIEGVSSFSRENLTKQLITLLDSLEEGQ